MKNRLQIKYYMPNNFPYTREEAKEYIENLFATNNENARLSLPAEPIAVFYGESLRDSNVILAIGRGGDTKRIAANVPYFLIDTAKISEDALASSAEITDVKAVAEQAKSDIAKLQTELSKAVSDIVAIKGKIGEKSDGITLDTVYGYINSHVHKILGGEVIEGLSSINSIANAIKRLRLRVSSVETNIADINTRMNALESSLKEIDSDYDTFAQELNKKLDAEVEKRTQEHIAIRNEFAAADATTLSNAKTYTDTNKTAAVNEAIAYTNSRENEITKAYKEYVETAKVSTQQEINKVKVNSSNNSLIVTSLENGTDIKVNIDGNTIVRDEQTGHLKVASEKLVQYDGNGAISVTNTENGNKTIELKINDGDKILTNDINGLYTTLTLKWVKGEVEGAKDQIQLLGKDNEIISSIDVAEFLKDGMLENVTLNSDDVNNPKLVFVFNSTSGKQTIEVPVKDLLYVYSAGNGLTLTDSVFDIKIADDSENYLTVSSNGLKLNGINQLFSEAKQEVDNAKVLITEAYTKADEALLREITTNNENIDKLNGTVAVDGSVKNMIYASVIGDVINTLTPEDAKNQSLLKKISIDGVPYFYASNDTSDMMHGARVLSEIIFELVASNEKLKEENELLVSTINQLSTKLNNIEEDIKNMDFDVDSIKDEIIPIAVAQAKREIISSDVFKGSKNEIGVSVVNGESVTLSFSDDAVFMADYNNDIN